MKKFEAMFNAAQDPLTTGITTDTIAEEAHWELPDGKTIEANNLGRDFGFDIIARNADGTIAAYVCSDNGPEHVAEDLDGINDAIEAGIYDLNALFGMWENGLGGSPFDEAYFPED